MESLNERIVPHFADAQNDFTARFQAFGIAVNNGNCRHQEFPCEKTLLQCGLNG
jgi:hypothetical protein